MPCHPVAARRSISECKDGDEPRFRLEQVQPNPPFKLFAQGLEAMRSGDDWRVVCWPFPTREQADKARALLASRGMKLQVVDF